MDEQTKADLITAANLLIKAPNAHSLFQTMLDTAPLMARHKELRLTGDAAALNPLALLKVAQPDVYDGVIELVERKRAEAGYEPLETAQDDKFDKSAYMQLFMEQKRLRQRRAADVENLQRADRDKLVGRARLDFMQRQSALWKTERDAFLQRAREAAAPRRLKKDDIALVLETFWKKVDERLDALEDAARSGRHSGSRGAASLAELEAVLRHDPYK
jgi:hypothetical protein